MKEVLQGYFDIAGRLPLATEVTDGAGKIVKLGDAFEQTLVMISRAHSAGNTLRFVGNGGSAGIASHISVDLLRRAGIRATALNDAAMLTCLGNDMGYEEVFAHQLSVHSRLGDILIAISSSGLSANILKGCKVARESGAEVVTFSGFDAGNSLRGLGSLNFYVASLEYGFVELTHMALLSALVDILIGWRPEAT